MHTNKLRKVCYGMLMLAMVSCIQEDLMSDTEVEVEVTARIEMADFDPNAVGFDTPMTKTFIVEGDSYDNGVGTWWRTKETIGVYGSYSKNAKFTSTNSKDAEEVSFKGSMLGTPNYAYYPYSDLNAGVSQNGVKLTMPLQHLYHSTFKDLTGDFRAGVLDSRNWFSSTFTFKRLVSILKVSVDATGTELENSTLRSVSLKVNNSRKISGDFTLNLESQAVTLGGFVDGNDSLSIKWNDEPALLPDRSYTAYVTALPSIAKGDEITFTVLTDTHSATFKVVANDSHVANGLYSFPLILDNFKNDMVLEDFREGIEDDGNQETPVSDFKILSMKFEAALNPGKILTRTVKGNSSTYKTSYEDNASFVAECEIDQENHKITMYLPYLNSRKLVPTIETTEGALLAYMDGMITSGETEVDFSVYKQIAVGNDSGLTVYDVEFINTGLPVVVINQETGTTSSESDNDYTKGSAAWYAATGTKWQPKDSDWKMTDGVDHFMVYNFDGTSALVDKNGAIINSPILSSTRVRGNVTQQMPKKPFAVKLDKKHGINIKKSDGTVVTLPAHKRWVLLANWKDRTLMRNEVAYGLADVFKKTFPEDGMEWNPSGEFVELVYNGVHVGTYYLCEQIKIDENRLAINEPYDSEDAYSGNATDYGYLLESDDGYDESWQFTTANYIPFLFKDDGNSEMLSYAQGFVRGIEDKLYSRDFTSAYESMDITSFVDFWLIQELMMNSETKHPKSCYSYINDGKMYAGPLWDFDWNTLPTSTSYSEEGYSYTTSMMNGMTRPYHKSSGYPTSPSESDVTYLWYPMLVKDAQFKTLAAERWAKVSGALKQYVSTEIPKIKAEIAVSEAVNNSMWPLDNKNNPKRSSLFGIGSAIFGFVTSCGYCGDEAMTFDAAVSTLQSTLNTRINGMDTFVGNKNWPSTSYRTK